MAADLGDHSIISSKFLLGNKKWGPKFRVFSRKKDDIDGADSSNYKIGAGFQNF